MKKIKQKDFDQKIIKIKKQIIAIENDRDLKLDQIRKRVEARQIKKLVNGIK